MIKKNSLEIVLDSGIIMRDYLCDIQLQHTSLDVI
jgi:hypothetical protein